MTLRRDVGFHSRPRSVDRAAPSIVVASIFAAIVLLAAVQSGPAERSDGKPRALAPGTAVLPLDAGQRHLDVAGQRLPDHLGIKGAQVISNPTQQISIGGP
jgi:hypothetical protein